MNVELNERLRHPHILKFNLAFSTFPLTINYLFERTAAEERLCEEKNVKCDKSRYQYIN